MELLWKSHMKIHVRPLFLLCDSSYSKKHSCLTLPNLSCMFELVINLGESQCITLILAKTTLTKSVSSWFCQIHCDIAESQRAIMILVENILWNFVKFIVIS